MEDLNRKESCISCGKCEKRYWLLILGALIAILLISIPLSFVQNNKKFDIISLSFVSYSFFINLGESLMVIPYLILKTKISNKKDYSLEEYRMSIKVKYIKYLFNENPAKY